MILKIYSDIVSEEENLCRVMFGCKAGVSFDTIDDFVASIPEDDGKIEMQINCPGGLVSEGWAIVDKLRSTGKDISAIIDGTCASMAVSVLLAASERRAQPHATLHIHKPYIPEYTLAGAYNEDDLEKLRADLARETEKMLDWYVERTGADREELRALMEEDKTIDMDEALRLGFVHSIVPPMSASTATRRRAWARHNNPNNETNMANSKLAEAFKAFASALGLAVNIESEEGGENPSYTIETADNRTLTIYKEEGAEPAVGDQAEPDGEFPLEDGRIIVVADGVITEIREAAPGEGEGEGANAKNEGEGAGEGEGDKALQEENAALKAENEQLKAEADEKDAKIAELEAKVAELEGSAPTQEDKAILETVNKAGGAAWLAQVAQSTYTPTRRANKSSLPATTMEERVEELRARKANKSKK